MTAAYRQAAGLAPIINERTNSRKADSQYERAIDERGRTQESSKTPRLTEREAPRQQEVKLAPRKTNQSNASLHLAAQEELLTHIEAVKHNPLFAKRSNTDIQEIAELRSLLAVQIKNKTTDQQSKILGNFDSQLAEPSVLERLREDHAQSSIPKATEMETKSRDDGLEL